LATFRGLREFNESEIIRVIMEEIKTFLKTIQNGKTILEEMIEKEKKNQNKSLS
jgi:alanyl-tRNA synthetase